MDPAIAEGLRLFNSRKFFEAHEALEAVWLRASGDDKFFLHGLIQVAAAFHHHSRHNPAGFRSLLEKGYRKLERSGDSKGGIDVEGLRRQLQSWRDWLSDVHTHHGTMPALPSIASSDESKEGTPREDENRR